MLKLFNILVFVKKQKKVIINSHKSRSLILRLRLFTLYIS